MDIPSLLMSSWLPLGVSTTSISIYWSSRSPWRSCCLTCSLAISTSLSSFSFSFEAWPSRYCCFWLWYPPLFIMKSKGPLACPEVFFFLPGMMASTIFSSAISSAMLYFSSSFFCLVTLMEASTRSLIIESTSRPTYPTSVNFVASTLTKGASMSFASLLAISVLPQPVGPIISIFFGVISSLSSSERRLLLYLFLRAMATDFFASSWPMMYLSSSATICFGVMLYNLLSMLFPLVTISLQKYDR